MGRRRGNPAEEIRVADLPDIREDLQVLVDGLEGFIEGADVVAGGLTDKKERQAFQWASKEAKRLRSSLKGLIRMFGGGRASR